MKVIEFKNMSKGELQSVLKKKTEELYELKVKNRLGQLANPLSIRLMKKDIARVMTVLSANKGKTSAEAPVKTAKLAKTAKSKAAPKAIKAKKVTKAGASRARK